MWPTIKSVRNKQMSAAQMNRAYVLIDTDEARAFDIVTRLHDMLNVSTVDVINGPYRIIAVLEGNNLSAIAKTVVIDIRKLSGVRDLIVYMAMPKQKTEPQSGQEGEPAV
jgi:hypothetical protein